MRSAELNIFYGTKMQLYQNFNENLAENELFIKLQDEMSKYKTLAHSSIKWDSVFEYSYQILCSASLDIKILNYLYIATTNLNTNDKYQVFIDILAQILKVLKQEPQRLGQNEKILNSKKKIIKSIIEAFIKEYNEQKIGCNKDIAHKFTEYLGEFEGLLGAKFNPLIISALQSNQTDILIHAKDTAVSSPILNFDNTNLIESKEIDISYLKDREYREYFLNLAFTLLKENVVNIGAYAMFVQAMWGRIKAPPLHNGFITQIRKPEQNLIISLKNIDKLNDKNIKFFMSNLALNPFWIEGIRIFCDFLKDTNLIKVQKFIIDQTDIFLQKNKDIVSLKFQNEEDICPDEIYSFFTNTKTQETPKQIEICKNIDDALASIDSANKSGSIKENLSSMILMAELFSSKDMKNNAKIMYMQIANLIENTELKEYLSDIYKKAKTFCK